MLTVVLVSIVPIGIIIYEQRKVYRINKIFNFRKELKRVRRKKADRNINYSNSTFIGTTQKKREVRMPDNAKHVLVCGTTGSGKTVALANYIKSGVEKGYPMLIIDGKGDTGNRLTL